MLKKRKKLLNSRDLSWLSFNGRVLEEAAKEDVPLLERLKFLAIYSSNLDEFYRVRIPVLMALKQLKKQDAVPNKLIKKGLLKKTKKIIESQQAYFGTILKDAIIPALNNQNIRLIYNEAIPEIIKEETNRFFFDTIAAFIEIHYPERTDFFPKNNQLYLAAGFADHDNTLALVNIPSDEVPRFFRVTVEDIDYIVLIDDIIRAHLPYIFTNTPTCIFSFKVTRDAELDLQDEFSGDLANEIEKLLNLRDYGMATRLLYQPGVPKLVLNRLIACLQLEHANHIEGGVYHNLRDFFSFPIKNPQLEYTKLPVKEICYRQRNLFEEIKQRDLLLHTPYNSYNTILRFFNEAVLNPAVEEIYITLYRVATNSQIVHALISAAKNGKKVTVFVELKARFDEANNIKWAKRMESAGVKIIYSDPKLKVHAKVSLIKLRSENEHSLLALLSTGNFNENTAKTYTDHSLLTASPAITKETAQLFDYLSGPNFGKECPSLLFHHLLVARFNLHAVFIDRIDNEIRQALNGEAAGIILKVNNLEEETLIYKLYEASQAGVKIDLIVRGICRIRPGLPGVSENIRVLRIVDRYLEHGRIFIFHNGGNEQLFLGSADWMDRNIYRRIEVCFPIYDELLKDQIKDIIALQLEDNTAAVQLDQDGNNIALAGETIRSQEKIQELINASSSDLVNS
ncbi:polyphosphate kinase 1 [Olivibacter sp. XZL3]|uniref:polyphosphate kinase 1 n=1 Tax=Olivibacter sp. XZL3 TaxID=1735116 RepID=UPI0010657AE0|nr:polyphosphate kinase 1 [Olivibacter sp. XZL3]